jgi:hypothetical protein
MQRPTLVFILLSLASFAFGQGYHEEFQSLFNEKDTSKIRSLLTASATKAGKNGF